MVKRSLGTILNDILVGTIGGIGTYNLGKFGYDLGQKIMENPEMQTGEIISNAIKYGPMALLGGLAVYGTALALKGTDKISLERQITKEKKEIEKEKRNLQITQEEIEDYNEEIQELKGEIGESQERINEKTNDIEELRNYLISKETFPENA